MWPQPWPKHNSAYQGSHCSTLLIGCLNLSASLYVTFMILQSFVGFCFWCVQRGAGRTHCRNYWWISRDRNSTNRRKCWDYGYDFECSTKTFFEEKTWLFIGYRSCWKGIVFLKATYLYHHAVTDSLTAMNCTTNKTYIFWKLMICK